MKSNEIVIDLKTGEQKLVEINTPLPPEDTRPLEEVQATHHDANCTALEDYLASHPITWTDGEKYGVTKDDQNLMMMNLFAYKLGTTQELEWNSHTKKCRVFTEEEFGALAAAIDAFVRPRVKRCQDYKERIFQAQTIQEVEAIIFDYDSV